jgi:cell division protein FtsX
MNPLANPFVRIALAGVLSSYVAPKVINRFVRVELNSTDEAINNATAIGITAGFTALGFVVLGMVTGKSLPAAAAGGA